MEPRQTEAVVDALAQNAAGLRLPLQNHQVADALFPEGQRRSQTGRTAAEDDHIL